MDSVQRLGLGIPIILLSAIWGAFGLVVKVFELLNERRDAMLDLKANPVDGHDWYIIFWHDWIWLWIGTCMFLTTVTGVILFMPKFFADTDEIDEDLQAKTKRLCYAVSLLPGFSAIGFFIGGVADIFVICRA